MGTGQQVEGQNMSLSQTQSQEKVKKAFGVFNGISLNL